MFSAGVILLIVGLDYLITARVRKLLVSKSDLDAARWFFIHAVANLFVCVSGFSSVCSVVGDPLHALDVRVFYDRSFWGDASSWPLTIINSVHIYHMIGGFKCVAQSDTL